MIKLGNATYDTLKWIALIVLPACGTLYAALANLWDFPCGDQVVGTIAAITVFMGAVLQISNYEYKKAEAEEESTEE